MKIEVTLQCLQHSLFAKSMERVIPPVSIQNNGPPLYHQPPHLTAAFFYTLVHSPSSWGRGSVVELRAVAPTSVFLSSVLPSYVRLCWHRGSADVS